MSISRRNLITGATSLLTVSAADRLFAQPSMESIVKPTPQQVVWQQAELTMFLHFGINTFTDREWGDGKEDPRLFNPTELDAAQWVGIAKESGFKYIILTAKHHDGFCLWPSQHTEHSVKSSPWRNGKGDVVGEFAKACHDAKIKMGLYLSPWDRHEKTYGDSPTYNRYYIAQLTELLTRYGEVAEVWFDGANGEGPNGKKQEYDWSAYYTTIRKLQPKALIAISGPDIRWVGNEDGYARETEWSVQKPDPVIHKGVTEPVWWPAECDVSIRPGWFWHKAEDTKVKSLDHLKDIYFKSVGRNSNLLLNVPPDNRGLFAEPDATRLREFASAIHDLFAADMARRARVTASSTASGSKPANVVDNNLKTHWSPASETAPATLEIDLGRETRFDIAMTKEQIREGQRVEEYRIEAWTAGTWKEISRGTTVGHKKLDRFPMVVSNRVRWTFDKFRATPMIQAVGLYSSLPPK